MKRFRQRQNNAKVLLSSNSFPKLANFGEMISEQAIQAGRMGDRFDGSRYFPSSLPSEAAGTPAKPST
ncbi:Nucleolar protein 16 [Fusarium oxysporum f. sp. albedinis]|nr:Nucleolar protein 16 [Fusarium oxysporum f. sp. albedinis]